MHNDAVVLCLRRLAFVEARCVHLDEDDAHDCAMEMVLHALLQVAGYAGYTACQFAEGMAEGMDGADPVSLSLIPLSFAATHLVLRADLRPEPAVRWLRRCARNFALNYRRRIDARQNHEVACNGLTLESDSEPDWHSVPAITAPSAEMVALDNLLHEDVCAAVHRLLPGHRTAFTRFHLHGDSLAEIAFSSGKSPDAVKKTIHRSRCHVRTALTKQGHGTSE